MRGKNLIKLLNAIDLLSRKGGVTIKELEEKLNITRRNVYRTKEAIEELGFPVLNVKNNNETRWTLEANYITKLPNLNIPRVELTLQEILALYLVNTGSLLFENTEIESHLKTLLGKLSLFVPGDSFNTLDKIRTISAPKARFNKDYSGTEEIIARLADAMINRDVCKITYHSFTDDKEKRFKINPLNFFENDGGLYILVNISVYNNIRTLAVERIVDLEKDGEKFSYPKDFNPEELLSTAFDIVYDDPIDVKVWFASYQAKYIKERVWSKTQQIEEMEDGSIIISMSTSGWWDVKKWVLSYGPDARVIEPEALRDQIVFEFKTALDVYLK